MARISKPMAGLTAILLLGAPLVTGVSVGTAHAGGTATAVEVTSDALTALNRIRAQAGRPAIGIDPSLQKGTREHACWMVRNDTMMHGATPGTPGYTADADLAGRRSNIGVSSVAGEKAAFFVDAWASGPYHLGAMLRSNLQTVGYGHCVGTSGKWRTAATLDIISGLGPTPPVRPLITFPADGATTHLTKYVTETPDPLVNCPGWSSAGLPLMVMFPETPAANTTASLVGPNGPVSVCVISQHNDRVEIGRSIFTYDRAVAVMPAVPLTPGRWTASVVSGSQAVSWSFNVDPGAALGGGEQGPVGGPVNPAAPAKLVPLAPCRLIDTRNVRAIGYLGGGMTLPLQVAGKCGVPLDATAVALTITSVSPARTGYLTVYPSGTSPPTAATLNVVGGIATRRANSTLASLGPDGKVEILAHAGGFVVVDVTAAFVPVSSSTAGRLMTTAPDRILDTRDGGRPGRGGTVHVPLPDGVPSDAVAVVVNVSTTQSSGPGYFSAYPAGTERPSVSILNTDAAFQTRAASAIVPVNEDGFEVYSHLGDHVIVDFVGWFTGPSAPEAGSGLFVADTPVRIVDSRSGWGAWWFGESRVVETGITGASALAMNVTLVGPVSSGFLTAFPSGESTPGVSTVNAPASATAANAAIVPTTGSRFSLYAHTYTHVVIDRVGWFTGD